MTPHPRHGQPHHEPSKPVHTGTRRRATHLILLALLSLSAALAQNVTFTEELTCTFPTESYFVVGDPAYGTQFPNPATTISANDTILPIGATVTYTAGDSCEGAYINFQSDVTVTVNGAPIAITDPAWQGATISSGDVIVATIAADRLNRTTSDFFPSLSFAVSGSAGILRVRPATPTLAAPTTVEATVSGTNVVITWSPVDRATDYKATPSWSASACEVTGNTNTTCSFPTSSLDPGSAYDVDVVAIGKNANVIFSVTSSPTNVEFTLGSPPEAISLSDVTPGDQSATLEFPTPDATDNPITDYTIDIAQPETIDTCSEFLTDPDTVSISRSDALVSEVAPPGVTSITLSRAFLSERNVTLSNRITYCVRLKGVNDIGDGTPSEWRLLTPFVDSLGAPTAVAVSGDATSAWLTFLPASGNVVDYDVSVNNEPWTPRSDDETTSSPIRLSDLVIGEEYTVRIRAVDGDEHAGPPSEPLTFTHRDSSTEPTPAPDLELVVPEIEPVIGVVDGRGILTFTATLENTGDGVLQQAWLRPTPSEQGAVTNMVADTLGTITAQGNGRWFWSDLDLDPGASTTFTVTIQIGATDQ